jgi:cytochrome c553
MRQNMASAMSSGDMNALAAAFEKVAKSSPDPKWNGADPKAHWDAIARAGLAAAKANDAAGAKGACKTCHEAYKDKYKATYRLKAVP